MPKEMKWGLLNLELRREISECDSSANRAFKVRPIRMKPNKESEDKR